MHFHRFTCVLLQQYNESDALGLRGFSVKQHQKTVHAIAKGQWFKSLPADEQMGETECKGRRQTNKCTESCVLHMALVREHNSNPVRSKYFGVHVHVF